MLRSTSTKSKANEFHSYYISISSLEVTPNAIWIRNVRGQLWFSVSFYSDTNVFYLILRIPYLPFLNPLNMTINYTAIKKQNVEVLLCICAMWWCFKCVHFQYYYSKVLWRYLRICNIAMQPSFDSRIIENTLTLWRQLTLYTHGLDLMLHSK